jgi:putative oxidoreductase
MLNPFPSLLIYSLFAPLILRVLAGLIFFNLGFVTLKGEKRSFINSLISLRIPNPELTAKAIAILEIVGGIMFILGFYTQVVALVLGFIILIESYVEFKESLILKRDLAFYVMLFGITISLLFSGAGAFAIDLPL